MWNEPSRSCLHVVAKLLLCLAMPCAIASAGEAPASDAALLTDEALKAELADVSEVLRQFPPRVPEPPERAAALKRIDALAQQDVDIAERPPMQEFLQTRMRAAVEEIEAAKVTQGAQIWKLYNHAFVVRTPSTTIGFDLVHWMGARTLSFDPALMKRLVAQCDILFVSHMHGDHTDEVVVQDFIDAHKPVVGPPDLFEGMAILRPERKPHELQTIPLAGEGRALQVVVYPGHQERPNVLNNVVLVITPDGFSVAHTGDQFTVGMDNVWSDKVAAHHRVDLLLVNCWTFGLSRIVDGFKPNLVITGHENELGHSPDHREQYGRSYEKLAKCSAPGLVMAWGESYTFAP